MPRSEVMGHMLSGKNIALIARRQMIGELISYFFVSQHIISDGVIRSDNKGGESLLPLYLYPSDKEKIGKQSSFFKVPKGEGIGGKCPNLSVKFISEVEKAVGLRFLSDYTGDLRATFGPEDVFHYMYAVFHSPAYRSRYAEFLKIDFPRLPLTSNVALFRQLCGLGKELVALHLLESPLVDGPGGGNPVYYIGNEPSNPVEKGYPKFENNSVHINMSESFCNISNDVWEFHIGGYQVCHKWLKDRRGRQLSKEDIAHYQKIVNALGQTIRLMGEVDEAIESAGGWLIK